MVFLLRQWVAVHLSTLSEFWGPPLGCAESRLTFPRAPTLGGQVFSNYQRPKSSAEQFNFWIYILLMVDISIS